MPPLGNVNLCRRGDIIDERSCKTNEGCFSHSYQPAILACWFVILNYSQPVWFISAWSKAAEVA